MRKDTFQYWHYETTYGLARYLAHVQQRKYRVFRMKEDGRYTLWKCEPVKEIQ